MTETTATTRHSGSIDIGNTQLYYEVLGHGPTLLLISGGGGDAGLWSKVAPRLAQDFMVVTYDRRGYSRSPRPTDWTTTSVAEQADDAAALLRRLDLAPALTVGHSSGASIVCSLIARHPDVVRHGVSYEPPLLAVIPQGEQIVGGFRGRIEQAMAKGGPRRAMEMFMRTNAGDSAFEHWRTTSDPAMCERIMDNASVVLPDRAPRLRHLRPRHRRHPRQRRASHRCGWRRQPRNLARRRLRLARRPDSRPRSASPPAATPASTATRSNSSPS